MSEQKINFKDIDYRGIKEGLIDFLSKTESFKDANFEGSFLSQLVSMFSYTGAIFGNYINSMANENFISTCRLYETGNLLSRLIGYKAHGFSASRTGITVEPDFDAMGLTGQEADFYGWTAVIPRNITFSSSTSNNKGKNLVFSNLNDSVLTLKDPALDPNGNPNRIALDLVQGIPLSVEFTSDGSDLQSFEIPNPFIDWKEIKVFVENDDSQEEGWTSVLTFFQSGPDAKVYVPFINEKGLLEILFAEGNFGKIPGSGKTIRIEYFATQGAAGKVAAGSINALTDTILFSNPSDPLDNIQGRFIVTQASESTEGANIEALDRIKEFSPLYFGIQNRLVNGFDYQFYLLGEYPYLVDAKAFSFEEAVNQGLVQSPCSNEIINERFKEYTVISGPNGSIKDPAYWDMRGFGSAYTVEAGDTVPVPSLSGPTTSISDLLNFGTTSGLFVDTARTCDDFQASVMTQNIEVDVTSECCNVIHFEAEVMNVEIDSGGTHLPVSLNDVGVYINGEKCFSRISEFKLNSSGYKSEECCCDREGDVVGWYVVKGIALLNEDQIDTETQTAKVLTSVVVRSNQSLLFGEIAVYPSSCLNANDVFIVPVPETGGALNIATKDQILTDLDQIDMINVRNHIISPIYQVFDIRVIFVRDESSILSSEEIATTIRSELVSSFLPRNRKLGDTLNTLDFQNLVNDIQGVARASLSLIPRSLELRERQSELGDVQLLQSEFPILGKIVIG